jgi:hypothetical protein
MVQALAMAAIGVYAIRLLVVSWRRGRALQANPTDQDLSIEKMGNAMDGSAAIRILIGVFLFLLLALHRWLT